MGPRNLITETFSWSEISPELSGTLLELPELSGTSLELPEPSLELPELSGTLLELPEPSETSVET